MTIGELKCLSVHSAKRCGAWMTPTSLPGHCVCIECGRVPGRKTRQSCRGGVQQSRLFKCPEILGELNMQKQCVPDCLPTHKSLRGRLHSVLPVSTLNGR